MNSTEYNKVVNEGGEGFNPYLRGFLVHANDTVYPADTYSWAKYLADQLKGDKIVSKHFTYTRREGGWDRKAN